MTTLLTGYFRGGDPPTSMALTLAPPVKGDDPAAAARAERALAYGTTGGIAPGLYHPAGSHEVVGDDGAYGTTGGIAPGLYNPVGSHEVHDDGDTETFHVTVPARAANANGKTTVGTAPFAGVLSSVTYTPTSPITGADTDSRTVQLVNLGTPGDIVVASFEFTNGNDGPPLGMSMVIPLSSTPSDLVVAEGDILEWQSVVVGAGLADPGGSVSVTLNS